MVSYVVNMRQDVRSSTSHELLWQVVGQFGPASLRGSPRRRRRGLCRHLRQLHHGRRLRGRHWTAGPQWNHRFRGRCAQHAHRPSQHGDAPACAAACGSMAAKGGRCTPGSAQSPAPRQSSTPATRRRLRSSACSSCGQERAWEGGHSHSSGRQHPWLPLWCSNRIAIPCNISRDTLYPCQ